MANISVHNVDVTMQMVTLYDQVYSLQFFNLLNNVHFQFFHSRKNIYIYIFNRILIDSFIIFLNNLQAIFFTIYYVTASLHNNKHFTYKVVKIARHLFLTNFP